MSELKSTQHDDYSAPVTHTTRMLPTIPASDITDTSEQTQDKAKLNLTGSYFQAKYKEALKIRLEREKEMNDAEDAKKLKNIAESEPEFQEWMSCREQVIQDMFKTLLAEIVRLAEQTLAATVSSPLNYKFTPILCISPTLLKTWANQGVFHEETKECEQCLCHSLETKNYRFSTRDIINDQVTSHIPQMYELDNQVILNPLFGTIYGETQRKYIYEKRWNTVPHNDMVNGRKIPPHASERMSSIVGQHKQIAPFWTRLTEFLARHSWHLKNDHAYVVPS